MQRIPVYVCPSEVNDKARTSSTPVRYPSTYAGNYGSWFVFDPNTGQGGDGAFPMNRSNRAARKPEWLVGSSIGSLSQ